MRAHSQFKEEESLKKKFPRPFRIITIGKEWLRPNYKKLKSKKSVPNKKLTNITSKLKTSCNQLEMTIYLKMSNSSGNKQMKSCKFSKSMNIQFRFAKIWPVN